MAIKAINHSEVLDPRVKAFILSKHNNTVSYATNPIKFKTAKRFPPALAASLDTTFSTRLPVLNTYKFQFTNEAGQQVDGVVGIGYGTTKGNYSFKQGLYVNGALGVGLAHDDVPVINLVEMLI